MLGRGNMGEVHRAEDLEAEAGSPHRQVAVKTVLRARTGVAVGGSGSDKEIDRFRREVRIMRMLSQGHPNLTLLVDGGVDEAPGGSGLPYLAMELLDGDPLADLIDEEPQLPVSWVAAIGAQIASGLTAAHTAGVVHRDLKPANVMLTRDGTVKILDFGMGSVVDDPDQTRLTSTGVSVGTARYMAPEQFRAERVSAAADLYALGCILYELLIGRPPFSARTPFELSQQHLYDTPPQVTLVRPDLPAELVRLVERLLEKDAENRPENAAMVREALIPLALAPDATASLLGPHWQAMDPVARLRALLPEPAAPAPAPVPRREPRLPEAMDVFGIHADLIDEYANFTKSATVFRDARIESFVEEDLAKKSQWPDPWLSLNPFFADGGQVTDLVRDGLLHPRCAEIFQAGKRESSPRPDGRPLTFHLHQRQAIEAARAGDSYVLTTGTGSGKSLSYIVPIVDRVLREREAAGRNAGGRVRAIVVYPMNALANSQLGELEKYLRHGFGKGREPVTFARYTGQETQEERAQLRKNPPDILLTNYVMLELMLTRPDDRDSLIGKAEGLRFLVFDELHTYRGRQGRRCGVPDPPGAGGVPRLGHPPVHRHVRDDVHGGHLGGPAARGGQGGDAAVRYDGAAAPGDRRDPGPRDGGGARDGARRAAAGAGRPALVRGADEGPAGALAGVPVRAGPRGGHGAAAPPRAGHRGERGGGAAPGVRGAGGAGAGGDPHHPGGGRAGEAPGDGAPAVRVPAAPVPVEGRHRLHDARGPADPAADPHLSAGAAGQRRQAPVPAGVLP
ncbi:hypothetical protein GCM10020256_14920 [Streptomyces thermocoprophilus]